MLGLVIGVVAFVYVVIAVLVLARHGRIGPPPPTPNQPHDGFVDYPANGSPYAHAAHGSDDLERRHRGGDE
jgi:hypothetical protein